MSSTAPSAEPAAKRPKLLSDTPTACMSPANSRTDSPAAASTGTASPSPGRVRRKTKKRGETYQPPPAFRQQQRRLLEECPMQQCKHCQADLIMTFSDVNVVLFTCPKPECVFPMDCEDYDAYCHVWQEQNPLIQEDVRALNEQRGKQSFQGPQLQLASPKQHVTDAGKPAVEPPMRGSTSATRILSASQPVVFSSPAPMPLHRPPASNYDSHNMEASASSMDSQTDDDDKPNTLQDW